MGDDWIAARRLVSALRCGAVDNFVAIVDETHTAGRRKAVALPSVGEVAATAHQVHGPAAQDFLNQRFPEPAIGSCARPTSADRWNLK